MNTTQRDTGLRVKAYADWRVIEKPVCSMEEAVKLFDGYRTTPRYDSVYIFQGDRIVHFWVDDYEDEGVTP